MVARRSRAVTLILASVSAFFGGNCDNIINAAFDGAMAIVELMIPVGLVLVAAVGVWYWKWGRDTRIGESGMGTVSWSLFGIGVTLIFLGAVFGDINFSSVATEQCVNGVKFIK